MGEPTAEEVRALLRHVAGPLAVRAAGGGDALVDWQGHQVRASMRGTSLGRMTLVLGTTLASFERVAERVPVAKLLEHVASHAAVRLAVIDGAVVLESSVVWDEVDGARVEEVLRWRLAELGTLTSVWRARLGLAPQTARPPGASETARTLAELKQSVRITPEQAMLVAAAAFGVAGADGVITAAERDTLRAWLAEVPAFEGLDPARVVRAIASLVADPAKALMETARVLEAPARLLAWGLANEMAHADGFASEEERRYLANVATVFRLGSDQLVPLAAEAQQRAVERETLTPPERAAGG